MEKFNAIKILEEEQYMEDLFNRNLGKEQYMKDVYIKALGVSGTKYSQGQEQSCGQVHSS